MITVVNINNYIVALESLCTEQLSATNYYSMFRYSLYKITDIRLQILKRSELAVDRRSRTKQQKITSDRSPFT